MNSQLTENEIQITLKLSSGKEEDGCIRRF